MKERTIKLLQRIKTFFFIIKDHRIIDGGMENRSFDIIIGKILQKFS